MSAKKRFKLSEIRAEQKQALEQEKNNQQKTKPPKVQKCRDDDHTNQSLVDEHILDLAMSLT